MSRRAETWWIAVVLAACVGCAVPTEAPSEPGPLTAPEQWRTAVVDPLQEHRPGAVHCDPGARAVEDGALEILTGICNYASLEQPSTRHVRAGDTIRVVVYHEALDAPEPATGHAALLLDGELLWETTVRIPAEAAVYEARVQAPAAADQAAPVHLHLHNHGFNSWTLLTLDLE